MKRRQRMLEELDQDLRAHIEIETRDNIEQGMTPDEAHYAALRKFGMGSSRVDLQACKLEYSIVSPK